MGDPKHNLVNRSAVWVAALLPLAGATCYEIAVSAGAIPLGPEPGQGPPGENLVLVIGLLTSLLLATLCWYASVRRQPAVESLASLAAPAGAAFAAARFYTFDPYYLPTLRRMSDGGFVPAPWVFVLIALAIAAAGLVRYRPVVGFRLAAGVLLASAATALFEATGH